MLSLIDTSLILELAKCQLFDDFLKTTKLQRVEILILRETWFKLEKNQKGNGTPLLCEASLTSAKNFCNSVQYIKAKSDPQEDMALTKKWDDFRYEGRGLTLDGGEACMFGHTRNLPPDSFIWTADKRSLVALSQWPNCQGVHKRIMGRVYCWERIVRDLIEDHGFEKMSVKICPGYKPIDDAVRKGRDGCCDHLLQLEQTIQADCGRLLAD